MNFASWCAADRDGLLSQVNRLQKAWLDSPALALDSVLEGLGLAPDQLVEEHLRHPDQLGLPELYARHTRLALELARQRCPQHDARHQWSYAAIFCMPEPALVQAPDFLWLLEPNTSHALLTQRVAGVARRFLVEDRLALARLVTAQVIGLRGSRLVATGQTPRLESGNQPGRYRSRSADPFGLR
ncbi:MAG: hypothetical protein AB7S38_02535 [Vulcanimicrobiota bacterium]